MRELSVYVTGIAAFVEDYRRVVAVNAFLPSTVASGRSHIAVPAHFPYVRLPVEHIEDPERYTVANDWSTVAAPGVFANLVEPTLLKFLRFQEVVLPDSPTPPSIDDTPINATRIPIIEQTEDGPPPDLTSVLWLAAMENLTSSATIDPKYVTANPGATVAAYIRFPKGRITTAAATPFRLQSVAAADGTTAGHLDQAVAQLMVCKLEVPDGAFTILCRDYRTAGQNNFVIRFRPDLPDPWMVFACTSLEDALQLPSDEDLFGVDTHFQLVYRLAQSVKAGDVVLPRSTAPAEGEPRPLGGGKCVPPRFRGGSTGGI